ncbi:MAG: efflux RND transporter periplasmic adaptor subunit [Xanthomonadales bacterium PRO6]|nr:efflux RND transporter periplasmic adaptor subunit [Xanthomonadales bacterium PRO6]
MGAARHRPGPVRVAGSAGNRSRRLHLEGSTVITRRLFVAICVLALLACQDATVEPAPEVVASVVVEPAAAAAFLETIDAYGSVDFATQQTRILDSAAEVIVEQILVSPGQSVDVGDPLLRIRATANSALELSKAQTDLKFAESSQARTSRLLAQQLATNADVDTARQAAVNARAALANVRSRVGGEDSIILRAEAAGIVASVDVARAAIVPASAPLLHMADSGRMQARLAIEPADIARLRQGQSVTLVATYDGTLVASGVVNQILAQIDSQSRLAAVIVDLPPSAGLMPGTTVRATIELARRESAIAVSRAAVLYADQRPYVFVLDAGIAHQVWVAIGKDDGARSEITAGLAAGDPVVTLGNYELKDGMRAVAAATRTVAPLTPVSQ